MTKEEKKTVLCWCRQYMHDISDISFNWLQDLQNERDNRRKGDPDSIYSELTDEMLERVIHFVKDTDDALDTVQIALKDINKELWEDKDNEEI